jgi:hypothetical protein
MRLHSFAFFIMSPFNLNYTGFERDFPLMYLVGTVTGIAIFGALYGNLLHNKM